MERIAIIGLWETHTKFLILDSSEGRFQYLKESEDAFTVGEEIEKDKLLKPQTISKLISVLTIYREMIQSYGVTKIVGVASKVYAQARNQKGFFEEVYNNTGITFTILNDEDNVKYVFGGLNNKIDASKAFCVFVDLNSTYLIRYNRRTVIDYCIIPCGLQNLELKNLGYKEMVENVTTELKKVDLLKLEEGEFVVGAGEGFVNFGRLAKKLDHYPIDIDNNYPISEELAHNTFNFVKDLDMEKVKKVKGMLGTPTSFLAGIAIIEAVYKALNISDLTVSDAMIDDGIVYANLSGEVQDKFNDLLGNSFANMYEFRKNDASNNLRVANMAGILFKQLKVMHKLPRLYVKPMRVAAYMYDSGKSISFGNYEKHGLYAILNSGLCGVSQKELLLAGFICMCQNSDNFSLSEWVKYKDIVNDEDLDAVRKLGVILKLAVNLNSTRNETVTDIICDILGDSIIIKTVVNGDAKYDILQGMKVAMEYRKIFKKNLQII